MCWTKDRPVYLVGIADCCGGGICGIGPKVQSNMVVDFYMDDSARKCVLLFQFPSIAPSRPVVGLSATVLGIGVGIVKSTGSRLSNPARPGLADSVRC
jgi:hypothetical protein